MWSVPARTLLAMGVLGGAVVLYFWGLDRAEITRIASHVTAGPVDGEGPAPPPLEGGFDQESLNWYTSMLPRWRALQYVSLADRGALERVTADAVRNRRESCAFDEASLSRDLASFFWALSASNAEEYLVRMDSIGHALSSRAFDDAQVHGIYRRAVGEALRPGKPLADAFRALWQSAPRTVARPVRLATHMPLQVARSLPAPPVLRAGQTLYTETSPTRQFSVLGGDDRFPGIGPFCQGLPRLTYGRTSYDELIRSSGHAMICEVLAALQTSDDRIVMVNITLYYSPQDGHWFVQGVSSYYPAYVTWPV